jgi:hypothetical protein
MRASSGHRAEPVVPAVPDIEQHPMVREIREREKAQRGPVR